MAGVDFGKYKRAIQYFWDPEPTNDAASRLPIWCLGQEYKIPEKKPPAGLPPSTPPQDGPHMLAEPQMPVQAATPPDSTVSTTSSVDSGALAYNETGSGGEDGGWPAAFLDDFEAKIWLTYRSNFPAIAKSQDPKAFSVMSLSVRLRSQLVDQGGFTSDTGWGCMIRSGQSLLANSLLMLRMGRGMVHSQNSVFSTDELVDWRRHTSDSEERELLSLFADDPKAPYSIHKFVEHGATACGKHPGQWFGPSATAQCIQ